VPSSNSRNVHIILVLVFERTDFSQNGKYMEQLSWYSADNDTALKNRVDRFWANQELIFYFKKYITRNRQ